MIVILILKLRITIKNIYDPSQWEDIDTKLRDLLVEKCTIRITDTNFSKDKYSRHSSVSYYIQKFSNWEKPKIF